MLACVRRCAGPGAVMNGVCMFLGTRSAHVMQVLKSETLLCNSAHLGALMADHAPKDWRVGLCGTEG